MTLFMQEAATTILIRAKAMTIFKMITVTILSYSKPVTVRILSPTQQDIIRSCFQDFQLKAQ